MNPTRTTSTPPTENAAAVSIPVPDAAAGRSARPMSSPVATTRSRPATSSSTRPVIAAESASSSKATVSRSAASAGFRESSRAVVSLTKTPPFWRSAMPVTLMSCSCPRSNSSTGSPTETPAARAASAASTTSVGPLGASPVRPTVPRREFHPCPLSRTDSAGSTAPRPLVATAGKLRSAATARTPGICDRSSARSVGTPTCSGSTGSKSSSCGTLWSPPMTMSMPANRSVGTFDRSPDSAMTRQNVTRVAPTATAQITASVSPTRAGKRTVIGLGLRAGQSRYVRRHRVGPDRCVRPPSPRRRVPGPRPRDRG